MTVTKPHLLLTRPEPANQRDSQQLQAAGFTVSRYPLLTFAPILDSSPTELSHYLKDFDTLIALSPRSCQFCQPSEWPKVNYVAIGQGTGKYWQQQGLTVHYPQRATSEGIIDLFTDAPFNAKNVLILRGQTSRDYLPEKLSAGGLNVSQLLCYQQLTRPITSQQFEQWRAQNVNLIVCTSEMQVDHLIHQAHQLQMDSWLAQCSLAVPSQRIAQMIAFPFEHVYNCEGASSNALLTTLKLNF